MHLGKRRERGTIAGVHVRGIVIQIGTVVNVHCVIGAGGDHDKGNGCEKLAI